MTLLNDSFGFCVFSCTHSCTSSCSAELLNTDFTTSATAYGRKRLWKYCPHVTKDLLNLPHDSSPLGRRPLCGSSYFMEECYLPIFPHYFKATNIPYNCLPIVILVSISFSVSVSCPVKNSPSSNFFPL